MEETKDNAQKVISKLLDMNARVVLCTNPPSTNEKLNDTIRPWVEAEKSLIQTISHDQFHFINLFETFPKEHLDKIYTLVNQEGNPVVDIKPGAIDPIHYNKLGNAMVASILLKEVFGIQFDPFRFMKEVEGNKVLFPDW